MKLKILLSLLLIQCCTLFQLSGQQKISGEVTSTKDKEPVIGATVVVKGTQNGTITDLNGQFVISANPDDSLDISSVGYQKKTVAVNNQLNINVFLDYEYKELDQVVVIGYGTMKKSDLTGSVASVSASDFNPGPVTSVSGLLQNTAPGVVLMQASAQPGGDYNVRVRGTTSLLGTNDPLYVIDGMPLATSVRPQTDMSRYLTSPDKNPLNGINPEDIVAIEILKDASAAAIYGARGANGVVLITTRQGQSGEARINYNYALSLQTLVKEYDMLNAKEFGQETNRFSIFTGFDPVFSAAEVNSAGEGTNWIKEITRMGQIQNHQLSYNGGNERTNYYISGNYYSHEGIVKNTSLNRFSGRINLNSQLSKRLSMGVNLTLSHATDEQVHFGRTEGGGNEFAGLFDNARTWCPMLPVRQPDGSFTVHPGIGVIPNPVSLFDIDNQIVTLRNLGTVFTEYKIIEGLKAKVNLGFDKSEAKNSYYIPTTVYRGAQVNGEGGFAQDMVSSLLGEFTLNYNKEFGIHSLSILAGYTYQQFDVEGFMTSATDFASEITNINNLAGVDITLPSSSYKERSRLLSNITRIHYNLADRYLFTINARMDGSTRFGENHKWAFFPSGAFAWKISNEDFYKIDFINELKLRIGYGFTGNQEFPNKQSQALYTATNPFILGDPNQINVGLQQKRAGDPDLKWETTSQLNPGLDIAILRNRIVASVDYYYKLTKDVLLEFELPSTAGFATQVTNAGTILNTGVELALNTKNLVDELQWTTSFNMAYNKNRWVDRAGYYFAEYEEEHGPVGGTYGFIVDGIFQTGDDITHSAQPLCKPGMFRFRDVDGRDADGNLTGKPDTAITGDDRVLLGYWQPDYTLGLNNIFRYKNFDLSIFIQGMIGHEKENYTRANLEWATGLRDYQNKSVAVKDRWTPTNPSNTIPSGVLNGYGHMSQNSIYIEDASFLRLRNITLGYNFSAAKLGQQTIFQSCRIYVDGQNLILITGYKGLDPETDETNQYPNAKTYTFGINITF